MRRIRLPKLDDLLGRDNREEYTGPPALVVVGLGNPGEKYAHTRHNVGFWCVDRLAKKYSVTLERRHRTAIIGEGVIDDHRVVLVKPRTFVNRSGETVSYLLARYSITPKDLLIIYDEINLPPGKIRLRARGSAGGHNGIRSIIEAVGTQDFPRLRIGVGHQGPDGNQIEHVLGTMSPDELEAVEDAIERTIQAIPSLLSDGIDTTMNRFN